MQESITNHSFVNSIGKLHHFLSLKIYYDYKCRREQQAPGIGSRGKVVRSLIKMAPVLEAPLAPAFPAGTLRDYQWEGVRWLLFNWSQKRNRLISILFSKIYFV